MTLTPLPWTFLRADDVLRTAIHESHPAQKVLAMAWMMATGQKTGRYSRKKAAKAGGPPLQGCSRPPARFEA